jgi:hypothetical protein
MIEMHKPEKREGSFAREERSLAWNYSQMRSNLLSMPRSSLQSPKAAYPISFMEKATLT